MVEGLRRWHSAVERMVDEPWRGRIKAFLNDHHTASHLIRHDGKVIISGLVAMATEAALELEPFEFNPGRGYVVPTNGLPKVRVTVPNLNRRSLTPAVGDHITCVGTQVVGGQWSSLALGVDTVIVFRPKLVDSEPLNVLHVFAGAYGGWTRALHWLSSKVPAIQIAHELFIDNDERIMKVWSCQYGTTHHQGRTPSTATVDLRLKTGICTGVDDLSLLHAWPHRHNSVMTDSPPCISWSQGGRKQGFSCSSGYAMIETIMLIEVQQPLLLFLEGADSTVSHEHFPILEALLDLVGFHRVWQQVVHMHHLTHNQRSRWLGVWARHDLGLKPHETAFELRAPPLVSWCDELNSFWTPESFHHQLRLTQDAMEKYGNPGLLPPAKRARTTMLSSTEVLNLRLADRTHPLPTLCSSYTRQHLLQVDHVMTKGIFAALEMRDGSFCFTCPTRFVPLFGTTAKITLPSDASFAFHILGNAISQSQATLCLAVGVGALFALDLNPVRLVRQAWTDRLTTSNSLVQVFEQWLTISRVEDIASQMPCRVLPMSFAGPAVALQLVHQSKQHEWYAKVPAQATLTTVVILTMFTKGLRPEALRFHATDGTLLQDIPIADALATASQIECLLWTFPLLLIRAQSPPAASRPAPHADEIPPTVPFSAREDESLIIALDSSPAYRLSPELFQEMLLLSRVQHSLGSSKQQQQANCVPSLGTYPGSAHHCTRLHCTSSGPPRAAGNPFWTPQAHGLPEPLPDSQDCSRPSLHCEGPQSLQQRVGHVPKIAD